MHTPRLAHARIGAVIFLAVFAAPVHAQFTNFSQTGLARAVGSGGVNQETAPSNTFWNVHMMSNAGPVTWSADAEVVSTWTPNFIEVHSTSAISPGSSPPAILTQAIGQLVLTFDLTVPVLVDLEFEVDNFINPAGVPLDVLLIELRNMTTNTVVQSGEGEVHDVALTPGTYRLSIDNQVGNTLDNLNFLSSARLLDIHITIVPAPASALALFGAWWMRRRRA